MPPCEQAETLDQGEQDPLVPLHREPLPHQGEDARRLVQEPYERFHGGPANPGVRVPREPDEDLRTRPQRGTGPRGQVVRGIAGPVGAADADEEFHDLRPAPLLLADGEREEKRNTGERRVVHVSPVVHGAVHPVERGLPLGRVGGGQSPQ